MGGRATSDNLGSIRLQASLPFGPESVRGGNLGERTRKIGAPKPNNRTEHTVIVVPPETRTPLSGSEFRVPSSGFSPTHPGEMGI